MFEVWMEGFHVQGMDRPATAVYLGAHQSETFEVACKQAVFARWPDEADHFYNAGTNTYYGCRFFDNESDARKTFG